MKNYFKGYWLATSRCNLDCTYCVLEDSRTDIARELDLNGKKRLLSHLYENLNFRKLTISGGEPLIIDKNPPSGFLELMQHLKPYKSANIKDNFFLTLNTNALFLTEELADAMVGVIELVSITIDSNDEGVLKTIGRSRPAGYYSNALRGAKILSDRGIEVMMHTVISKINVKRISDEVIPIYNDLRQSGSKISKWKFYQYMSYDVEDVDERHSIPFEMYIAKSKEIKEKLNDFDVDIQFKDTEIMKGSLFNILAYGNAQMLSAGSSWKDSLRSRSLLEYNSMEELLNELRLPYEEFIHHHGMNF
jgi:MoaA/NifB/PqqE/SkfB family radical SAM enzyme